MKTRWLAMGMAVAVMVSGLTSVGTPRAAAEEPSLGWDESTDIYGLIFPVEKDYRYGDTYGACRSGCSRRHEGIDIKAPKMTKVFAAASGTVGWMHNDQGGKCCAMALYHDDGWETWYIHLNNDTPGTDDGKGWGFAPGIWSGVHVDAGDLIAYVGDSGNAEGTISHLHFELMRPGRNKINPYPHLKAAEPAPDPEPEPAADPGEVVYVGTRVDDGPTHDGTGNDSKGNNDGAAQCGETIELWVTARNVGTKLLNGVTARLSESDPYLSILYNAGSAYPDIPADRSRESARDWELAVSDKAPDGHRAMLKLTFNADGGGPWEVSVELPLGCG